MRHDDKGIALITALAIMVVVSLLVFGTFFTTQIELWVTRNDVTSTQATYIAEAGLQEYKARLFQYFRWIEEQGDTDISPDRTICFNRLGEGIDWDRNGSKDVWGADDVLGPYTHTVSDTSGDIVGTYEVTIRQDPNVNHYFTVRSKGMSGGATEIISATFEIRNSGILEQAVFSGEGQNNKHLNGGAIIRGGIYIVGSDPNEQVIDSTGNFTMLNHYDLTSDPIRYGDAASKMHPNNRVASNLCATLRVQSGKVQAGGSVAIGQPNNKLLGVYVGRGNPDISGVAADVCKDNKGICTDQGPSEFDLGDPPEFPTFDGEPGEACKNDGHTTWRACIHAEAEAPGKGLRIVHGSPPTFHWPAGAVIANQAGCEAALAADDDLNFLNQIIDCTYTIMVNGYPHKAGFKYEGLNNPATFRVYGSVNLQGYNLTLGKDTNYVAVTDSNGSRANNASLVIEQGGTTTGNLHVVGKLLPNTTDTALGIVQDEKYFPQHVLGLIVENNIMQQGPRMMAPVYAGENFRIVKNNVLFGSVIANNFCTTSSGSENSCNGGQSSEVVYINTGNNKPEIMRQVDKAGLPTFKVISYERR